MKKENLFFLILILTILITRLSIYLVPEVDITVFGTIIHHFWIGIALITLSQIIKKASILNPAGLGLAADQLIFILLGAGKDAQYWAAPSIIGTIIITSIVFILRKNITSITKYQ